MDWREVTIYTTTEGIGPVEALLEDNGVEGYVLEDAADFEEFLKDTEIYWDYVDEDLEASMKGKCRITFYLPADGDGFDQLAQNLSAGQRRGCKAVRGYPCRAGKPQGAR